MILRFAAGLSLLVLACADPFGWKQQACDDARSRARDSWETVVQALPAEVKAQQDRVGDALRAESVARLALPASGKGHAAAAAKVAAARSAIRRRARGRDAEDAYSVADRMSRGEPAVTYNYLSRPAYTLAMALREQKRLEKEKKTAQRTFDSAQNTRRNAQARLTLLHALGIRVAQAQERASGHGNALPAVTDAIYDLRRQLDWDQKPPAALAAADAASWDAQKECEGVDDGPADPLPALPDATWTDVATGAEHTCAVQSDGWLSCWGDNQFGQSTATHGTFAQAAAGSTWSCARRTDATVSCWGDDVPTAPEGRFTSVTAGSAFACGLRDDGHVSCWGDIDGAPEVGGLTWADAGNAHVCALSAGGAALCWGSPSEVLDGPFTEISAGDGFTCAVRVGGELVCWGDAPAGAPREGHFHGVSAGADVACALAEDGAILCWGGDRFGETRVPAGSFVRVAAGDGFACALTSAGAMSCWGRNHAGQAGDFWSAGG